MTVALDSRCGGADSASERRTFCGWWTVTQLLSVDAHHHGRPTDNCHRRNLARKSFPWAKKSDFSLCLRHSSFSSLNYYFLVIAFRRTPMIHGLVTHGSYLSQFPIAHLVSY